MKVSITLMGPLIRHTDYEKDFELEAATPAQALRLLGERFPKLGEFLYRGGKVRPLVALFVDSEPCSEEEMEAAPPGKDQVSIFVSVPLAGG